MCPRLLLLLLLISTFLPLASPFGLPSVPTPLTLVNKIPFMRQFTSELPPAPLPTVGDASDAATLSLPQYGEVADLPNPIVPVLFTFVLLAGVGALTGSLGDVVAEEVREGGGGLCMLFLCLFLIAPHSLPPPSTHFE